jgi:hypothetical protein
MPIPTVTIGPSSEALKKLSALVSNLIATRFGELKQEGKTTKEAKKIVRREFDEVADWTLPYHEEMGKASGQTLEEVIKKLRQKYVWVIDPTSEAPCKECLKRSNMEAKTFSQWDELGLPGSAKARCKNFCTCEIKIVEEA